MMTLRSFQELTAEADEPDFRRALGMALVAEVPHDAEAYARFYRRVAQELGLLDASAVTGGKGARTAPLSSARP